MSLSVPPRPSPHELEMRNGPIFVGFIIDCILFGLLVAQICIYVRGIRWHRDAPIMQALVYFLCFIEFFRLIVVIRSAWGLLIKSNVRPGWVAGSTSLAVALPSLAGFESAIVQFFFSWRIWSMKREDKIFWVVAVVIAMVAIMQTGGSVGVSYHLGMVVVASVPDHKQFQVVSIYTTIWLAGSFICDLFIVFAMTTILVGVRKEVMFKETEKMIDYLLRLTIETGALTVLAAAVMLGLHLQYPKESFCLGILYILGGLYTNLLLFLLNSREKPHDSHNNEISLQLPAISEFAQTLSSSSRALDDGAIVHSPGGTDAKS